MSDADFEHALEGVMNILEMMRTYILIGKSQEQGCRALTMLCKAKNGQGVAFALRVGVLQAVLTALTAYPNSAGVQEAGTALFRVLGQPRHYGSVAEAMHQPALRQMMGAMRFEPWSPELRSIVTQLCTMYASVFADNRN